MNTIPQPNNPTSLRALQALLRQRSVLAALEVFHADLGNIFQIPLPGFKPVMLVGPEANRFVLVEQRHELRWRSEDDPVTRLLRHGVLVEDGDTHDDLRRQMNPALHRRMLDRYVEVMWQSSDQMMAQWGDAPLNMLDEMRAVALMILMQSLFSVDFEPDMQRLWRAILKTLQYISPGPWIIWRNIPRPGYGRALRQIDSYLQQIISQHRRAGPEDDLPGLLIDAGMPAALIRDQLLTMIIAGHDTSTALLSWALYLLSNHPEVQAQAQAEIDGVLGDDPPELAHIGQLNYLDQVVNETLRLYPPIHLGQRIAARDLDFQGYRIPAGRRVLYSIYLSQRDPRYWDKPADFCPDRFAPEQSRQQLPYTFQPFGGGPRNCIGMAFAQVEVKAVLARILQHFELRFTGQFVRLRMGATLEPAPGVMVKVQRRA